LTFYDLLIANNILVCCLSSW